MVRIHRDTGFNNMATGVLARSLKIKKKMKYQLNSLGNSYWGLQERSLVRPLTLAYLLDCLFDT